MTEGSPLELERRRDGGCEIVGLRGELDLTNAHALEEALLAASADAVILDLSGLSFIDSAGMRTIDHAHRRLGDEGRALLLVAPPESRAAWTFRIAGFAPGTVLDSLEVALRSAGGG